MAAAASGAALPPDVRNVAQTVYASPTKVAVNLDASRGSAAQPKVDAKLIWHIVLVAAGHRTEHELCAIKHLHQGQGSLRVSFGETQLLMVASKGCFHETATCMRI